MAEGFPRQVYAHYYEAHSAGVRPTLLDPRTVEVMKEAGVDISHQRSKSLELYRNEWFDVAATVCDTSPESPTLLSRSGAHLGPSRIPPPSGSARLGQQRSSGSSGIA